MLIAQLVRARKGMASGDTVTFPRMAEAPAVRRQIARATSDCIDTTAIIDKHVKRCQVSGRMRMG